MHGAMAELFRHWSGKSIEIFYGLGGSDGIDWPTDQMFTWSKTSWNLTRAIRLLTMIPPQLAEPSPPMIP